MPDRIVTGPTGREIARFGTPLALGMALQTTFNLVDAYVLASSPKEEVVALSRWASAVAYALAYVRVPWLPRRVAAASGLERLRQVKTS